MEIQSVFELLQSIPFFIWIALAIVVLFLFSDKQLWEYEVTFPYQEGVGRGEIEIEYYKKAKGSIDIELDLEPACVNKHLEIFLNDKKILDLPAATVTSTHLRVHEVYPFAEPHEGMNIDVRSEGRILLTGKMIMD